MSVFDQMVTDLEAYPETSVVLEIVDVSLDGDVLNEDEIAFFKVRVTNNGPLDLTDVTLKVDGRNGATVRPGLGADFVSDFTSSALPTIRGHGGTQELSLPAFQAPSAQPSKTLVNVTLAAWNAKLDHILIGHSDPVDVPKGIFAAEVEALND